MDPLNRRSKRISGMTRFERGSARLSSIFQRTGCLCADADRRRQIADVPVARLLLPGMTIVVSPLIALMHDQVDRLSANGIAATFINSSLNPVERREREQAAWMGEMQLLYVAPERLMTGNFLTCWTTSRRRVGCR